MHRSIALNVCIVLTMVVRKLFKHRQNHLEHIVWAHHDKKECPCTICHKMFQMPTNMRSHRLHRHGYIEEITPSYPQTKPTKRTVSTSTVAVKKR